jgi:hypothetical protein
VSLVCGQDNEEAMKSIPGEEAFISNHKAVQEGVAHHCKPHVGRVNVLTLSPEGGLVCPALWHPVRTMPTL